MMRKFFILIFIILTTFTLLSQEKNLPASVFVRFDFNDEQYDAYQKEIFDVICSEVQNLNCDLKYSEIFDNAHPLYKNKEIDISRVLKYMISLSLKKQAEIIVHLELKLDNDMIYLQTKLYDIDKNKQIANKLNITYGDLSIFVDIKKSINYCFTIYKQKELDFTNRAKDGLVLSTNKNYENLSEIEIPDDYDFEDLGLNQRLLYSTITVNSSDEGAEVFVEEQKSVGFIKEGKIILPIKPLAFGQILDIVISKPGFYSRRMKVRLNKEDVVVNVSPLYTKSTFAFEVQYNFPRYLGLGVGFRYYPIKDKIFVAYKNHLYGSVNSFNSKFYTINDEMDFKFGFYPFLREDLIWRFSIEVGPGFLITKPSMSEITYFDWTFSIFDLKMELNFDKFILYGGIDVKFLLGFGSNNLHNFTIYPGETVNNIKVSLSVGALWKFSLEE